MGDISDREVIVAILTHLGLFTFAPPLARARRLAGSALRHGLASWICEVKPNETCTIHLRAK